MLVYYKNKFKPMWLSESPHVRSFLGFATIDLFPMYRGYKRARVPLLKPISSAARANAERLSASVLRCSEPSASSRGGMPARNLYMCAKNSKSPGTYDVVRYRDFVQLQPANPTKVSVTTRRFVKDYRFPKTSPILCRLGASFVGQ